MPSMIKVGDTVVYRDFFGRGLPRSAKVVMLTLTEFPRDKYGVSVAAVSVESVKANKVMFNLDSGTWCYSEQVDIG